MNVSWRCPVQSFNKPKILQLVYPCFKIWKPHTINIRWWTLWFYFNQFQTTFITGLRKRVSLSLSVSLSQFDAGRWCGVVAYYVTTHNLQRKRARIHGRSFLKNSTSQVLVLKNIFYSYLKINISTKLSKISLLHQRNGINRFWIISYFNEFYLCIFILII